MSPKQEIYKEILRITLPHIRNHCSLGWFSRIRGRGLAHDSQLIHNIWPILFEPRFQEHDLWFLNHHCRSYAEGKARTSSLIYGHNGNSWGALRWGKRNFIRLTAIDLHDVAWLVNARRSPFREAV